MSKEFYQKHRRQLIDSAVRWNRSNPERRAEISRKYKKSEKGKASTQRYKQARRAPDRRARVGWRNQELIDAMYEEAKMIGFVVDHIVPFNHPLVCGLHCEDNLQIISYKMNRKKNNKFTVG